MDLSLSYRVYAIWERGFETPKALAQRVLKLVRALESLSPNFQKWFQVNYDIEATEYIDGDVDKIAARIACTADVASDGNLNPLMGYASYISNQPDADMNPKNWYIGFRAGGSGMQYLQLLSNCNGAPDPTCLTYYVIKGAVLAITEAFEPLWCAGGPCNLSDLMDKERRYKSTPAPLAWMINLSPELAKLVTPPAASIHDYGTDGSLFMTATTETFVTQNPEHLAAAQAIFAVVDPLNFRAPLNAGR